MNVPKKLFSILFLITIFNLSCSDDDAEVSIDETNLEVPSTYTFTRDGQSTVNIPGQVERIAMLEEIDVAFTDFEGTVYGEFSEQLLNDLFTNQGNRFTNNFLNNTILQGEDLNQSSRQIRNTTADSEDYFLRPGNVTEPAIVRAFLEDLISRQVTEVFTARNQLATPGNPGQLSDGTSIRYVNAQGLEYNEIFEKSLIGALQLDQIVNNYISPIFLDEDDNRINNDNQVPRNTNGTDTQMEHLWDEAFGYVYGLSCDIEDVARDLGENDGGFNNYMDLVNDDEDFRGIADDIFLAFRTGRAAIVANDYDERDRQIVILRELLSEVMAVRTVFYFQQGRIKLESARAGTGGEFGDAFHDISEGLGFLLGLRYTQNPNTNQPYYSAEQIAQWYDTITENQPNGLWDVTPEIIDDISDAIAAPFGFTRQMAETVDNPLPNAPGCN